MEPVISGLITQLKKARLVEDKFYLLKKASTRSLFFSPTQCLEIVRCFTHSEDKATIMDFIKERICTKIDTNYACLIVKSAAYSKDRLKILKALAKHLQELTQDEAKNIVASCFEAKRDRDEAWGILCQRFGFQPTSGKHGIEWEICTSSNDDAEESNIFQCIEEIAKSKAKPISAFDLPLIDQLSLLRETILDDKQAIADEVEKRRKEGQNVLLSRICTITRHLKPDRINHRYVNQSNRLSNYRVFDQEVKKDSMHDLTNSDDTEIEFETEDEEKMENMNEHENEEKKRVDVDTCDTHNETNDTWDMKNQTYAPSLSVY